MTSGQETEQVYSYNSIARTGLQQSKQYPNKTKPWRNHFSWHLDRNDYDYSNTEPHLL